jgi:uncharacterized tellurite resistance protein B-like protein
MVKMLFRKRTQADNPKTSLESLEAVVRQELGQTDAETVSIVTAIAGLLASVAYADREVTREEETVLKHELLRIQGLNQRGVEAIYRTLTNHILRISTLERQRHTRALVAHASRELRYQVLEVLLDLAAADSTISHAEVTLLRSLTTALGLTQEDYNELQSRHRDKLGSLR